MYISFNKQLKQKKTNVKSKTSQNPVLIQFNSYIEQTFKK